MCIRDSGNSVTITLKGSDGTTTTKEIKFTDTDTKFDASKLTYDAKTGVISYDGQATGVKITIPEPAKATVVKYVEDVYKRQYQKILVVGDNAIRLLNQGGGSSELKVKDMVSPLEGLRAVYGDKVQYAKGYVAGRPMYGRTDEIPRPVMDSLRTEAVRMAKGADLVILVGGLNKNHFQDCEGGDRLQYGLPFGQNELIEALLEVNKNMVLVLLSGNAVEMPWVNKVPAIVQGWYLGSMGGKSLADVRCV